MKRVILLDGAFGVLRNGGTVGPFHALDSGGEYAYAAGDHAWTQDGRFLSFSSTPHALDVVEVTGPSVMPEEAIGSLENEPISASDANLELASTAP